MTGRTHLGLVLLGITALVSGSRARADVDLTGSWSLDGGFIGVITVDVVQSGTSLTIGAFTGTIDRATGFFMVEAPPSGGGVFPDGTPYGPSPGDTMSGTAADDNHFVAAVVDWIYKITPPIDFQHFPWFALTYQIEGTRRLLASCGNGQLDPEEFCDNGIANGTDGCCSTVCTLIDGDGDGVCDSADDCPGVYDPSQGCVVPLELSSGHVSARGRVRLHGTLSKAIGGSFTHVTVGVGTTNRTDVITRCVGDVTNWTKVRCINADKSVRLRLQRPTTSDDWTFRLSATGLPARTAGPLRVEIEYRANGKIGRDELTHCTLRRSRVDCVP